MGSSNSRNQKLQKHELNEFAKMTPFNSTEINNIYTHFKSISKMEKDDGVIDYDEWCAALEAEKSLITKRLFSIIDENHDEVINFREFLLGISFLMEENLDSQIKITFRLFDPDNKGKIKADFVLEILKSAVQLCNTIKIPENTLKRIVEQSFAEFTKQPIGSPEAQEIDYIAYRNMIKTNIILLKWLYVDLNRVKESAKLLVKNPKKYTQPLHPKK